MIRLVFTKIRETIIVEVKNKIIIYKDRVFPDGIQFMPKDPSFQKKVLMSRNKIPRWMINLIDECNSGKNLQEYLSVKNDEELVPIIIKDFKRNACVFQKRFDEDENGKENIEKQN
jgi:hypothetical protein